MAFTGRLARPLLAATMAAMLTFSIFFSIFATTDAEASFATFNKGDKFALKGEKDFTMGYYSANQLLKLGDEETSWLRNGIIDNASLSGYMSAAMVYEVVDVTGDEYVMKVTAAQNISLDVELLMTAELVEPGVYITDWDDGYSENPDGLLNISEADANVDTFGVDGQLVAAANETYIVHLQKSDMAIKSIEVAASVYARGHLDLYNIPNSTDDYDYVNDIDTVNITSYESLHSNISLDLALTGEMSFDPYVTAVQDNPDEDSTWEVDTYVNGSFSWTGLFDMTGVPEDIADEIFDQDAANMGMTGFPIDLAKIYTPSGSGPQLDNGTMTMTAEPTHFEFSNLGNDVVNDPVYGNVSIYRLGFQNATEEDNYLEAWYYPAEGCLVGVEFNYPISGIGALTLDMKSVSATDAEKSIANISEQITDKRTYEQVNAVTVAGDSSNGLTDLLPIIALVAIAAIAVVGIVFVVKRRSKPKA